MLSSSFSFQDSPGTRTESRVTRATGIDASYLPGRVFLDYFDHGIDRVGDGEEFIGLLIPQEDMVIRETLYAAALTPKGRFPTFIAVKNAFRQGWKFVEHKETRKPLRPRLHDRLHYLTEKYDLKTWFTQAKSCAMIFGNALMWIRQVARRGELPRWQIHVTPLFREWIEYDAQGNVVMFRPIIRVGLGLRQFNVPPERAVVWINAPDLFGNAEQGQPELIASIKTIRRSESIAQNFAELISQKGMGQLDITIPGIRGEDEAYQWSKAYEKQLQNSVVVHSEEWDAKVIPGISAGYNYDSTQQSYLEDFACATGYPQMRMRGTQTGTVTGSETDQDNMAEVYSTIQESSEFFMKRFYLILDRFDRSGLGMDAIHGKEWEFSWSFEIKMDKMKKSNKLALDVNTVLMAAQFITVNQAMEIVELPLLDGEEGDMIFQQWIEEQNPIMFEDPGDGFGDPEANRNVAKERYQEAPRKENEANLVRGLFSKTRDELICEIEPGSVKIDEIVPKEVVAMALLQGGVSQRKTNKVLQLLFESGGLSQTALAKMRES